MDEVNNSALTQEENDGGNTLISTYEEIPDDELVTLNLADSISDTSQPKRKGEVKKVIAVALSIAFLLGICGFGIGTEIRKSRRYAKEKHPDSYYTLPSEPSGDISDSDKLTQKTSNAGLGVVVSELEASTAKDHGIDGGLVIIAIEDNSCLSNTDARIYDIITGAEGERVTTLENLSRLLNAREPGDDFTLGLTRFADGWPERYELTVKLIDKTAKSAAKADN